MDLRTFNERKDVEEWWCIMEQRTQKTDWANLEEIELRRWVWPMICRQIMQLLLN